MRFGWLLPKKIEKSVILDFCFGEVFFLGMTLTHQFFFAFYSIWCPLQTDWGIFQIFYFLSKKSDFPRFLGVLHLFMMKEFKLDAMEICE